jgi:serine/threonine protein kinase
MLSEEESRLYFQQTIMALEYCHGLNIIHRDLKPENILVDKKNHCIKISDFGLSTCIKTEDEILNDTAGTTRYLAPEVVKQTGHLGQAADIWSTGVILFNCVTGTFPFYGKNSSELLNNIITANVSYPSHLSGSLVNLFTKIFVTNPKKRYTIAEIKKHPWFATNLKPVIGYLKDVGGLTIKYLETMYDKESPTPEANQTLEIIKKGIKLDYTAIPL